MRPQLGDGIEWVGAVDDDAKAPFLQNAAALLVPIQWDEPFGLVVAEALACGTPVIAMARASMPELIRHGVTGFCVAARTRWWRPLAVSPRSIGAPAARTAKRASRRLEWSTISLPRDLLAAPMPDAALGIWQGLLSGTSDDFQFATTSPGCSLYGLANGGFVKRFPSYWRIDRVRRSYPKWRAWSAPLRHRSVSVLSPENVTAYLHWQSMVLKSTKFS